jgi:hypothetical protein
VTPLECLNATVNYIEIVDYQFAIAVNWISVTTSCGCIRSVTVWSATDREDRRPSPETEAIRWAAVLAGGLGLDSPLAICDRRRGMH